MKVSHATLEQLLLENVLDIRFTRRIQTKDKSPSRRMICTKSYDLLKTTNGRVILNYVPPKTAAHINESRANVCVVFDILMQDYRTISLDNVEVLREMPADDTFWKIFNDEIYPMSTEGKIQFMNS